jgi:hypothetical protein
MNSRLQFDRVIDRSENFFLKTFKTVRYGQGLNAKNISF